jgi:hypothetical protein
VSNKPTAEAPPESAKKGFSRQIDEAFEDASKLAGSSLPPTEFYEKFLNRTLSAIDAPAGVVWLRTPQGFLQIACQTNLDKIGLDGKRGGRQCHNEILRQVFQSTPTRPAMIEPQGRLTGVNAEPGQVPAANLTDYYTLFAPIVDQSKQALGLLEVFQEASHDPRMYQTFLQYTVQMAGYASQYHSFAGVRQTAGLEKLFSQIETFSKQIHSSLNPTEVAYHVANEGRRLVECDRLCVGVRHGRKVTVEAVSGADVVEKASTHVRRMRALFDAVVKFGDKLVYKGVKDEGLPPDLSEALDDYLAESQPKLLVVSPIRDDREKDNGKPARSVLLLESFNPPEQVEPMVAKLDVVSKHAAGALYNASEMQRIPFSFLWQSLATIQDTLGGKHRFYYLLGAIAAVALVTAMILVPYPMKMEAKGEFLPRQVAQVYAPTEGILEDIRFKPGEIVQERAMVLGLFSSTLKDKLLQASTELTAAQREVSAIEGSLANTSLPTEQELNLRIQLVKAKSQVDSKTEALRLMVVRNNADLNRIGNFNAVAPMIDANIRGNNKSSDWKVLNADNQEALRNRTVRPNEPLMRLGYVDGPWRVEMKIPQRNIGHITSALITEGRYQVDAKGEKYLDVDVLMTASPDRSFSGRLYEKDMAREAIPNRDDHNQSEPIMMAYVRVNLDDIPADQHIPRELFIAGQEVHARIRCGNRAMGYSLFHGVWEWFYEKVIFFF